MDLLSVFKADNQRQYLTQMLPGVIALWPFALLAKDGLGITLDYSVLWGNLLFISLYVFISIGVGVLLEDIGSLFELRLEEIYFDLKKNKKKDLSARDALSPLSLMLSIIKHTCAWLLIFFPACREWLLGCHIEEREVGSSREEVRSRFYTIWDKYLLSQYDDKLVALRYYRAILTRFKFELNVSAAFMLMLFGHLVLTIRENGILKFLHMFLNWDTWIYLGAIFSVVSILLIEAFKSIELLHQLRIKMTRD